MVARDPLVAFLRERIAGRVGDVVRTRQALLYRPGRAAGPAHPDRTRAGEVVTDVAKSCQLDRQQIESPIGDFSGFLVGDPVDADRFGFEVAGHVDQNLGEPELPGHLPAGVTDAQHTVDVDDQRLPEAKLSEDLGGRIDGTVVDAGIAFVRLDPLDELRFDGPGFDGPGFDGPGFDGTGFDQRENDLSQKK